MASIIQLKTGTGSAVPSSLTQGEVAINIDNGLFYFGSGSGNAVKSLDTFTNITASGNISASGNIFADTTYHLGNNPLLTFAPADTKLVFGDTSATVVTDLQFLQPSKFDSHITSSGNISASGNIIGATGSFAQTVVTLESGAEDSPFIITIANSNGQDNKLQMTKDGVLRFGALDTLPTAITGGLVYSSSAFYMGL